MRTNDFLKQYPPDDKSWAGKVTFSFGYPTQGWIQLAITCTTYVQGIIINFSNVFDPFPKFVGWLNDLAKGNLSGEFVIDEEGKEKIFRASPINKDEFAFEVLEKTYDDNSREQPIFIYVHVTRKQFLSEFLKRWDDFLKDQYDPLQWEEQGVDLRKIDVSKIRAFVKE